MSPPRVAPIRLFISGIAIEIIVYLKRTRISKLEIPALLPLCDSPKIPQLSWASTFQLIAKSYNNRLQNRSRTNLITISLARINQNIEALLIAAKLGETPIHGHP
jgi:hypothetical protein